MEKDVTMNLVCGIVADFMNQVNDGERFAFEKDVHALKENVELSDEQEEMERNSMMHMEIIANNMKNEDTLKHIKVRDINYIVWTIDASWHSTSSDT